MTNFQSIGGTMVWAAVAAILMLATFEPVSVEKSGAPAHQFAAAAPAAPSQA